MQAAYITISVIIIIASILITLVVLVQNSKGGGLAANFASGNQTFGVRQTADFLEKLTWSFSSFRMLSHSWRDNARRVVVKRLRS